MNRVRMIVTGSGEGGGRGEQGAYDSDRVRGGEGGGEVNRVRMIVTGSGEGRGGG